MKEDGNPELPKEGRGLCVYVVQKGVGMSAARASPTPQSSCVEERSRLAAMANALLPRVITTRNPCTPIRARLPSFLSFTKSMWMWMLQTLLIWSGKQG